MVFRTYVEKRQGLAPECEALLTDCRDFLGVQGLRAARIWNRYDVEGIEAPLFENACRSVFSEPPLDLVSDAADTQDACAVFAVEPLPGQFDQRADSAAQCIQLLSQGARPTVRTAKLYALYGTLTDADVEAVKRYVINPVESREASLAKPETLAEELAEPKRVASVEGFTAMDEAALSALLSSMGLAMDIADLKALQDYFRETERRDPTVTELRVVDTYWSDHCRHTTFSTHLDEIRIDDDAVKGAVAITSLSVGPTVTMIALSSAGLASISIWSIIGSILPLILGIILGNVSPWFKQTLSAGVTPSIIVVGFALGCGMSIQQLFQGGLSGILLGLITVFVVGGVTILMDKITGGNGVAGAAISSTAASGVSNPGALAAVDPSYAAVAPIATAQVAASVIITSFLTPMLANFVAKRSGKK